MLGTIIGTGWGQITRRATTMLGQQVQPGQIPQHFSCLCSRLPCSYIIFRSKVYLGGWIGRSIQSLVRQQSTISEAEQFTFIPKPRMFEDYQLNYRLKTCFALHPLPPYDPFSANIIFLAILRFYCLTKSHTRMKMNYNNRTIPSECLRRRAIPKRVQNSRPL